MKKSTGGGSAWKWTGTDHLEAVYELNERCLELFAAQYNEGPTDLWRNLDEAVLRRAARCPFLLADVNLHVDSWWTQVKAGTAQLTNNEAPADALQIRREGALANEVLQLAWRTSRSDARTAALLLGVSPGVATIVASLTLAQVRRIALECGDQLRPRWQNNHNYWRHLVDAASSGLERTIEDAHLYGLQLLGTDLLALPKQSDQP